MLIDALFGDGSVTDDGLDVAGALDPGCADSTAKVQTGQAPNVLPRAFEGTKQCRQRVVPVVVLNTPSTPTPPVVRSGFEGLSSSTTPPHPCVTARQSSPAPVSPAQPPPLTSQQSLLVAMFGRLSRHELCRVVLATWMHKARNMDALQCRAQSKHHKFDGFHSGCSQHGRHYAVFLVSDKFRIVSKVLLPEELLVT